VLVLLQDIPTFVYLKRLVILRTSGVDNVNVVQDFFFCFWQCYCFGRSSCVRVVIGSLVLVKCTWEVVLCDVLYYGPFFLFSFWREWK
jgi:hypothetical protein